MIPIGALLVIAAGIAIARWRGETPPPPPIHAAPETHLAPLAFPERSGTIDGALAGPDGAPIAHAVLWLRAGSELSFTESAPDGAFRFGAVASGPRTIGVLATGFELQRFELAENDVAPKLVLARAAPPPSLPDVKRSPLAGIVAAPGFEPDGAQVWLVPTVAPETLGAPLPARATCDREGRFAFDALIEGEYGVQLLPKWAANGTWPDLLRPLAGAAPRTLRHDASSAAKPLELHPVAGSVHGVLRDVRAAAIEAGFVSIAPQGDATRLWPVVSSGADGSFTCRDLPAGKYVLSVRAGGDGADLAVDVAASAVTEVDVPALDVARAK